MDLNLCFKRHDGFGRPYLKCSKRDNNICIQVAIPTLSTGLDEKLEITNQLQAELLKKSGRHKSPYILSIKIKGISEQDGVRVECALSDTLKCHVKVLKFKVCDISSFKIQADKVVLSKDIITDAHMSVDSKEDIGIRSRIRCPSMSLNSHCGNVFISPEGILRIHSLQIFARKTFIDGTINKRCLTKVTGTNLHALFSHSREEKTSHESGKRMTKDPGSSLYSNINSADHLLVNISGELKIGTDGRIGCERNETRACYNLVTVLEINVQGNMHNFGSITASRKIILSGESILSCRKCTDDTTQRYYESIKHKLGIHQLNSNFEIQATVENLQMAIKTEDPVLVDNLLSMGVNPNAVINGNTISTLARYHLKEKSIPKDESRYRNERHKAGAVASLIESWKKRSGNIIAQEIICSLKGNLEDCAQLMGSEIDLTIGGNVAIEKNSIWDSGIIQARCSYDFKVSGIAILGELTIDADRFIIDDSGRVELSTGGNLYARRLFHNKNIMYLCNPNPEFFLYIETKEFQQTEKGALRSKSNLKLTLLGDTNNWRGTIDASCLQVTVCANVEISSSIYADTECVVELLKTEMEHYKFHILKEGSVEVKNGSLCITQKQSATTKTEMNITFAETVSERDIDAEKPGANVLPNSSVPVVYNINESLEDELFIARKETSITEKEMDITIAGTVKTRGIDARKINIHLLPESSISIFPDINESLIQGKISLLCTDESSKVNLCTNQNCNEVSLDIECWLHKGEMSLNQNQKKNHLSIQIGTMINKGYINKCDNLNMVITKEMINLSNLIISEKCELSGNGSLVNDGQSIFRAVNGFFSIMDIVKLDNGTNSVIEGNTMSIATKYEKESVLTDAGMRFSISNKGILVSENEITISTNSMNNKLGAIISKNSEILLEFISSMETCIEGNVSSTSKVTIFARNANNIVFKCVGTDSTECFRNEMLDCFHMPKNGLVIECPNGSILMSSKVSGEAVLTLSSQRGCSIHSKVIVSRLNFRVFERKATKQTKSHTIPLETDHPQSTTNTGNETILYNMAKVTKDSETLEEKMDNYKSRSGNNFEPEKHLYVINVLHDIRVNEFRVSANDPSCHVNLKTCNESRITCASSLITDTFFNVQGDITFTGQNSIFQTKGNANISGVLRCIGKEQFEFVCHGKLTFSNLEYRTSMKNSILRAQTEIRMEKARVNIENGKLTVAISADGENVTGNAFISSTDIFGNRKDNQTPDRSLQIESNNLEFFDSSVCGLEVFDIFSNFIVVQNRCSIRNVQLTAIEGKTFDFQGIMEFVEDFVLKSHTVLNRGSFRSVTSIKIDAELAVVNCGEIKATRSDIKSPIYLNCPNIPGEKLKENFETLPIIADGGKLVIEGLLCIIIASQIQGKHIVIKSILRFDFASKTSTMLPSKDDLENWKTLASTSLPKIMSNSSTSDFENIIQQALKIPQVVCSLGVSSFLCNDIVRISKAIQNDGLCAFDPKDLVKCLNTAHTQYSKISLLQFNLEAIPKGIRKLKCASKSLARKLMDQIFSSTSKIDINLDEDEEGIVDVSYVFHGKETETHTSGTYIARSLKFGYERGIWKNEGLLETCGDIFISAKFIDQGGNEKKLMRSLFKCIQLDANKINVKNVQSKQLEMKATNEIKLENASTSGPASIASSGTVNIQNLTCGSVSMRAEDSIDIGVITAKEHVNVNSDEGNIKINSTITGETAKLEAIGGNISLKRKAQIDLKRLTMRTQYLVDLEEHLIKSGAYNDFRIAEEFDLAVEEQNVILANIDKMNFDFSLVAKKINIRGNTESSKGLRFKSKSSLTVERGATITAEKDIEMCSQSNTDILNNSSIKSKSDINIESKAATVSVISANIEADKKIEIKARDDINVSVKTANGPVTKSVLKVRKPKDITNSTSINLESGKDINVVASDVQSGGKTRFLAERNINLKAHTYLMTKTNTETKWLRLRKEHTTEVSTHVDKSKIVSNQNTFQTGGEFRSTASTIASAKGNVIHAKGNVSITDIPAKLTTKKTTDVLNGLLYQSSEESAKEMPVGTIVEDTCSNALTEISSETSDIIFEGSSIRSEGTVSEIAKKGKVVHTNKILTDKSHQTSSGFLVSSAPDKYHKTLGYAFHSSNMVNEHTSNASIKCGHHRVQAQTFEALNSVGIDVAENATMEVQDAKFKGAELNSHSTAFDAEIKTENTCIQMGIRAKESSAISYQAQKVCIGGQLKWKNVKNVKFEDSQADIGGIEGEVENLNLISNADTSMKHDVGLKFGYDFSTETPEVGISASKSNSKRINCGTSFDIKGNSNELSANRLNLTGATISFEGNVHNFAKEIDSRDVQEMESNWNFDLDANKQGISKLRYSHKNKSGRTTACITSSNGNVHSSLNQRVNTNINKCKVVDTENEMSINYTTEGKLSTDFAKLRKEVVKSVGKETLVLCIEHLKKEFGLSNEIVGAIFDIASCGNPLGRALNFMMENGVSELVKALVDRCIDDNSMNLVYWVSNKIGVRSQFLTAILEIMLVPDNSEKATRQLLTAVVEHFNFPEEITSIIEKIEFKKQSKKRCKTVKEKTSELLKSKEGQIAIRSILKVVKVPSDVVNIIIEVLNQSQTTEIGMAIFRFLARRAGVSTHVVSFFQCLILERNIKKCLPILLRQIGTDEAMIKLAIKVNECTDFKSFLKEFVRQVAVYNGVSKEVVGGIESMLQGKHPQNGFEKLIVQILEDMTKILQKRNMIKAASVLKEKVIPTAKKYLNAAKQILVFKTQIDNNDFSLSFVVELVRTLSGLFEVNKHILQSLEIIVIDKKGPLVHWLSHGQEIDTDVFIVLAKVLTNQVDILGVCQVLFSVLNKKVKFPFVLVTDANLILQGRDPQHQLKAIIKNASKEKSAENDKLKCTEFRMSSEQRNLILQLLLYYKKEKSPIAMFTYLASEIGIPEKLVESIKCCLCNKDPLPLAEWIENKPGPLQNLILKFLEQFCICRAQSGPIITTDFLLDVCGIIGIPGNVIESLREDFLAKEKRVTTCNILKLFSTVFIDVISTNLQVFTKHTGIPFQIIIDLLKGASCKKQCVEIVEVLAFKHGVSKQLFHAVKAWIFDTDSASLAALISKQMHIEPASVKLILNQVKDCKSISVAIQKLPGILLKNIGFSKDTSDLLQVLLSGKIPKCRFEVLKSVIQDLAKSKFGKIFVQATTDIAVEYGIPIEIAESLQNVSHFGDPLESFFMITELIAERFHFPKDVFRAISHAVRYRDPSMIISYLSCKRVNIRWTKSVLETIFQSRNMSQAIQKSSKIILEETGFTQKSISGMAALYKGRLSNSDMLLTLAHIAKDVQTIMQEHECFTNTAPYIGIFPGIIHIFINENIAKKPEYAAKQFIYLFLSEAGVNERILSGIESLLDKGNYTDIVSFICQLGNDNIDMVLPIVSILTEVSAPREKIEKLLICLCKLSGLSEKETQDIIYTLKEEKSIDEFAGNMLPLDKESHIVAVLSTLAKNSMVKTEDLIHFFKVFAEKAGLKTNLVEHIISFVIDDNPEPIALWISEQIAMHVKLRPQLVKIIIEMVIFTEGKAKILIAAKYITKMIGIDEKIIQKLEPLVKDELSDEQIKIKCFEAAKEIMIETVKSLFPEEIKHPIIEIMRNIDIRGNVTRIIGIFLKKIGITEDLIEGVIALVQEKSTKTLGAWIAKKLAIEQSLAETALQPLIESDSLIDGITNIPKNIARYVGLSDHLITSVEDIMNGKSPEGDVRIVLKQAAEDILKSKLTSNIVSHLSQTFPIQEDLPDAVELVADVIKSDTWLQQVIIMFRFLIKKLAISEDKKVDISEDVVKAVETLIEKRDPFQLVTLLAEKAGIDEKLIVTLVKVMMKNANPVDVVESFAEVTGFPTEFLPLIKQIIKSKTKTLDSQSKRGCKPKAVCRKDKDRKAE